MHANIRVQKTHNGTSIYFKDDCGVKQEDVEQFLQMIRSVLCPLHPCSIFVKDAYKYTTGEFAGINSLTYKPYTRKIYSMAKAFFSGCKVEMNPYPIIFGEYEKVEDFKTGN